MPRSAWSVKYRDRYSELGVRLGRNARNLVEHTAEDARQRMREGMEGPHSGVVYGSHQASAPGEMPAIDTAALIASIEIVPINKYAVEIVVGEPYGAMLENGTVHMAPRPFFRVSIEAVRPTFRTALNGMLR